MTPILLPKLRKTYSHANIADGRGVLPVADTFSVTKAHGYTGVRLPVGMIDVVPGAGNTPAHNAATIARLDQVLPQLAALDMGAVLCPFGSGVLPNVDIIGQTLTILTERYAPMIDAKHLGFELRNEPHSFTPTQWNAAAAQLAALVRARAPLHTMIVPPAGYDIIANLPALTPLADSNAVYTAHCYQPAQLTQQTIGGGPANPAYVFPAPDGTPGNTGLITVAHLNKIIAGGAAWAKAHNVPIMLGEFGCPWDAVTTTATLPGEAQCVYAKLVIAAVKLCLEYVGWGVWDADSRELGFRRHQLGGAWNEPYMAALDS